MLSGNNWNPSKRLTKTNHDEISREERKKKSRWAVLILLAATIGLTLFFYLLGSLPDLWKKITTPVIIKSGKRVKGTFISSKISDRDKQTRSQILTLTTSKKGTYGVYAVNLKNGQEWGINEDTVFPAASTVKLPVAYTLYRQAEEGKIDLDEQYSLLEEDKIKGTGSLYLQPAGKTYSYRELVRRMIKQSDNTAQHILANVLGREKIQAAIDSLAMRQTNYSASETTARDIGRFLKLLAEEKILTKDNNKEFLDFLTNTAFEEQIPAGIPNGVRVSHKVGIDSGTLADAAIVWGDTPFVLVVLDKEVDIDEANVVLPQIARAVWKDWEK